MKQTSTILQAHKMKNDYPEKQDNEGDTHREAKNNLFHVSPERQTDK